ncbi:tyrosine-type recombinase/integrase [Serratia rubidaea]|uniref:Site-specific tyrosine recombinase XerD n=1 Tax=Serratia rubidaea TaxID=61652 RepID=A0A448SNG8_SERRU|nr:tyrosine-type recombinase/integrase [Serratia rubidaea]VEI69252.1 site-specific tyrosine recombinase XerD [Serratia rubidaea]
MQRYDHLSSVVKVFLLDRDDITVKELREHLRSMAEQFLTDSDPQGYWNGVDVDLIGDTQAQLREVVATRHLTIEQHKHVAEALSLLDKVKDKSRGDASGLLEFIACDGNDEYSDAAVENLEVSQARSPAESKREPLTLSHLASLYLAEHAVQLGEATLRGTTSVYKKLAEATGSLDMRTHTRADLVQLREVLAEDRAKSTVNGMLAKLSTLLSWARLNGHIDNDYSQKLKFTKGAESQRKAFSPEQVQSLVDGARGRPIASLVALAAITGARLGELMQLTAEDIQTEDDTGIVCIDINDEGEGKSLKNKYSKRKVPLTDGAYGFDLKSFLGDLPESGRVFANLTRFVASKAFKKLQEETEGCNADGLVFHSLRHSMATALRSASVSLETSQGILGHSSQSITFDLYGRDGSEGLKTLAEGLKKALGV